MHAIILAAGYGRRMHPLAADRHKALLPVAGGTILGRIVESLRAIGVHDASVVTGYRADEVTSYLEAHAPDFRFTFVRNDRYAETNNIVSLSLALDCAPAGEDLLLIECDLIFEPRLLERLAGPARGNVALVDRYRAGMDGTVVSVDDGVITHVYPPHLQGPDFSFTDKYKTLNIYRFDAGFCRTTLQPLLNCYANLIDGNIYYELVLGMLVNMQRQRIAADVVDGTAWAEVDDPNDLAVARFQFEPATRGAILDRAFGGHWNFDVLDFSFMRNAYFPTDAMMAAMRQALPELLRSYGSSQDVLNEKLGYVVGCPADRLQALHGASQLFPLLPQLVDGAVAVPEPTFGEYVRLFPRACTYRDDPSPATGGFDHGEIERLAARSSALCLVTPNSPTGHVLPTDWIHGLASRHRNVRVIVDESFIDFSDQPSMVTRLEEHPLDNVLVVKSLSKTLGVPGLRLGYAYSRDRALIDAIGRHIPIWNLSAPAEYFLELLLKHRADLEASIEQTRADRSAFAAALLANPLVESIVAGGGNFLLLRLRGTDPTLASSVRAALLAGHHIEVKDVSGKFTPRAPYFRVAVRLPTENVRFEAALADVAALART